MSEEELVHYACGDAERRAEIERHLAECAACRANSESLKQVLAAVSAAPVPERGPGYGREVWARIEPKLEAQRRFDWRAWLQPQRIAFAGAMALLVLMAFLAGRFWPRLGGPEVAGTPTPTPAAVRERILLVAVGDHLERSQMMLIELTNTKPNGTVDIGNEQRRAEELVSANRLYRQTAANVGDTAMASVLDDLERALLEIAHSPSEMNSAQLAALQKRIEAQGILFKVRVIGSQVREKSSLPPRAGGRS